MTMREGQRKFLLRLQFKMTTLISLTLQRIIKIAFSFVFDRGLLKFCSVATPTP